MQQQPAYGQAPYYAQPSNGEPPSLEAKISARSPYVQENILLHLNIISSHNLKTAAPQLPQTDTLIFQKVEGPTASRIKRKDSQNIVTKFVYQVTPLRPGRIELPPIHVTGEQETGSGYGRTYAEFDAVNTDSLVLSVKPSDPSSKPWLPLEELTLKTSLPKNAKAVAGQPISLTIEMSAIGASGNQLPSLEKQLSSDEFRVYREKTRTSTKLNRKKSKITGRRVETFTLVPQFGGELKLPELRVAWWNTRHNTPQHVSTPVKPLAVSGGRRGDGMFSIGKPTTLFPAGSPAAFWIPVSVMFGVIFGFWLAIWISNRKKNETPIAAFAPLTNAMKRPFRNMAPAFAPLGEKFRATTAVLNPVTRWQKVRRYLIGMLPLSIRFWYCVRFVETEDDPEIWGYTLRFLANKHLGMPPRAPFSEIGNRILEFHPKADPVRVKKLVHDLDQSIYGDNQLDFEQWKQDFKYEIRPRIKLFPGNSGLKAKRAEQRLPMLNPRTVA
ncbi:MAG: BatD family protein [Pseudomonadota bacterium]